MQGPAAEANFTVVFVAYFLVCFTELALQSLDETNVMHSKLVQVL
jgi:hypothetical protein